MSATLLLVALIGAWNVFRLHPALPAGDRSRSERLAAVAAGGVAAVAALAALAALAGPVLDALDVTPPTARLSVGVVVALAGVRDLLGAPPAAEPALPGARGALVPVFFPFLLSPVAGLLALAAGADLGVAWVGGAGVVAAAPLLVAAWSGVAPESGVAARAERGLRALLAAALVGAGIALVVNGLFDI
jgi:small neutral amino acid transporter SnatA (MarC family)